MNKTSYLMLKTQKESLYSAVYLSIVRQTLLFVVFL